jgi:hypothetical protein
MIILSFFLLQHVYFISGLHLIFFAMPGACLKPFKMVNITACSALLDNLDLYKNYTYTGRVTSLSLGQALLF